MNINSNIYVPCGAYLNQWFQDALEYETLKKRTLAGELKSMPDQNRKFLLAFIEKQGWIHKAVENEDNNFVKALAEAGANLSALDEKGSSVLFKARTPDMFNWLREQGSQFVHANNVSLFQFVFSKWQSCWTREEEVKAAWQNLLASIMPKADLKDFCDLDKEQLKELIQLAQKDQKIGELLLHVCTRIIEEKSNEVLPIAQKLLSSFHSQELKIGLIGLIKIGFLKDPFIEQIVTDSAILFWNTKNSAFFDALKQCWKPTGDLLALTEVCGDLRLGIYFKAILKTTTLQQAAELYSHLRDFPDMSDLDETIKKRLMEHILNLQAKENSTIWMAMSKQVLGKKELLQMKQIGFDPHWTDPVNGRTFLFTEEACYLSFYSEVGFNLHQIDVHGDNALEYHCRHPYKENSTSAFEALAKLGIKLSDKFPNIEKCRNTFPDDPYLQAALGASLLHPRKHIMRQIFRSMSGNKNSVFRKKVCKDPELNQILGKYLGSNDEKVDSKNWKNGYMPADVERLKNYVKDGYSKRWSFAFLAKFWNGKVSSEVFDTIPESPVASLVVGAIRRQHEELVEGKRKKPVTLHNIFSSILNHDDMVHLNRYLFAHPELMRILVQDYMNAKNIYIQPGGGSITTYGKIISLLMTRMGKLLQLPKYEMDLPRWHQKLLDAFHARVPPIPLETLNIPDNATVKILGRTAIVTSAAGCDAFKFLGTGEKYDYFSQEHSVCKAFNEITDKFKSQIIKPLGVYAVKRLPSVLGRQQQGDQPGYVFHYQASPETFVYLQNVPAEKYTESRSRTLHDAAKLVRLGIYPDLAALFHSQQKSRRHVLLVDVMARLIREQNEISLFRPAGGSGSLENPLEKTRYPNARQTGMTDLRDACQYYGLGRDSIWGKIKDMHNLYNMEAAGVSYFYQMEALSNIMLVDMLILAERYMNQGDFQWKDDLLMQKFGLELADGFARLTASYSEQQYEQAYKFALECGIDWTRAARQIAFWLDTGPEGYPSWVAKGQLPPGLYEESIKVHVDVSKAGNFEGQDGFGTKGNLDIGIDKGPLALDQFEKAAHLLFNTVALAEPMTPPPRTVQFSYGVMLDFF